MLIEIMFIVLYFGEYMLGTILGIKKYIHGSHRKYFESLQNIHMNHSKYSPTSGEVSEEFSDDTNAPKK